MDHVEAGLGGHLQLVLPRGDRSKQLGEVSLARDRVERHRVRVAGEKRRHLRFLKGLVLYDEL